MATLIFDIETVGEAFDKLDDTTQEVLTRWTRKEYAGNDTGYTIALDDLKKGLGFSPLTGEVVAIGMLDGASDRGAVYYQAPSEESEDIELDGIIFKQMTEKEILKHFWEIVASCDEFVTFNGRKFDVPFLVLRSAIHGIRPSKDLLSNRYLRSQRQDAKHIDLHDQLSFYGSAWRQGSRSLHMYCRAFGIESPKAGGVTGDDVATLFHEKRFFDIAKYNVGDIQATKELYEKWSNFIRV